MRFSVRRSVRTTFIGSYQGFDQWSYFVFPDQAFVWTLFFATSWAWKSSLKQSRRSKSTVTLAMSGVATAARRLTIRSCVRCCCRRARWRRFGHSGNLFRHRSTWFLRRCMIQSWKSVNQLIFVKRFFKIVDSKTNFVRRTELLPIALFPSTTKSRDQSTSISQSDLSASYLSSFCEWFQQAAVEKKSRKTNISVVCSFRCADLNYFRRRRSRFSLIVSRR